ncbi:unnamed protein product [Urochloa humidicola]
MARAHHAAALGQATEGGRIAEPLPEQHHLLVKDYPNDDNQAHIIGGQVEDQQQQQQQIKHNSSVSWLTLLGFFFLSFNSGMAVYRLRGEFWSVAFVVFSYCDLVVLFLCLRRYELTPAGSPSRERLKVAVWILTTLLTFAFSYKVAAVMPALVAVIVWIMAFATVTGGFLAFFVCTEKK